MQIKLRRILQKQDGIAILLVLCLGALFVALAAALGYAASVLTANANSQLREITACAFSRFSEAVALISDEITLTRYSSTERMFTVVTHPFSTMRCSAPRKRWFSFRCQWKFTPMVTLWSSKLADDESTGSNSTSAYDLPFQSILPTLRDGRLQWYHRSGNRR